MTRLDCYLVTESSCIILKPFYFIHYKFVLYINQILLFSKFHWPQAPGFCCIKKFSLKTAFYLLYMCFVSMLFHRKVQLLFYLEFLLKNSRFLINIKYFFLLTIDIFIFCSPKAIQSPTRCSHRLHLKVIALWQQNGYIYEYLKTKLDNRYH